ncbi:MAG: RNA polymerase sigma factor [Bacteroidales bacterium]|nr:RNA polymerase sigma factor [Bacteroidales bacterium]
MSKKDDSYFIEKVKKGNSGAFKYLVERHKNMVFTIVLRIVRNREDAEEIAQDAFLKAFQSISSFKGQAKFSTWLYKIAYNLSISHTRKKNYEIIDIDENLISDYKIFETYNEFIKSEETEKNNILNNAISLLTEDEGLIITLYYIKEHSIQEIEQITSLSKSNIKIKLYRSRKKLFSILSNKKDLVYAD